jgi:hypothetical protein
MALAVAEKKKKQSPAASWRNNPQPHLSTLRVSCHTCSSICTASTSGVGLGVGTAGVGAVSVATVGAGIPMPRRWEELCSVAHILWALLAAACSPSSSPAKELLALEFLPLQLVAHNLFKATMQFVGYTVTFTSSKAWLQRILMIKNVFPLCHNATIIALLLNKHSNMQVKKMKIIGMR